MCSLKICSMPCRKLYGKLAALVQAVAPNTHRSAMHFNQLANDREPEPQAAISRRGGRVLAKSFKNEREKFRLDSDTVIRDRDVEPRLIQRESNVDAAVFGSELHRICQQI